MSKFDSVKGVERENLLMETAMEIYGVFSEMYNANELDEEKTGCDSIGRMRVFVDWAREFENRYHGTPEYEDDFIFLCDDFAHKKIKEAFGKSEPVLCGFVWCHSNKDFSLYEVSLKPEDREKIESILAKYETCGTSERNVWNREFSDVFCEEYK